MFSYASDSLQVQALRVFLLAVLSLCGAAAFGQTPIARYESGHRDRDLALRLEVVHHPEAPDWFPPPERLGPGPYLSLNYEVQTRASDGETTRTLWHTQVPYSVVPSIPIPTDQFYHVELIHDVSILGERLVVLSQYRSRLCAFIVAPGSGHLMPLNLMDLKNERPTELGCVRFLSGAFGDILQDAHIEVLDAKTFITNPPLVQNTEAITLGPLVFIAVEKGLYGNRPNYEDREMVGFFMFDFANPNYVDAINWQHATHTYPRSLGIAPQEAPTSLRHKIGQGRAFPDMPPYEEILEDALAKVKAIEQSQKE
ncbi:MAG: hypothetical protein KF858_03730 [Candidatus Sumerlaeia bacterium]|nr:hypothetical protein [Candidatus Sumerlaeia bacterium]